MILQVLDYFLKRFFSNQVFNRVFVIRVWVYVDVKNICSLEIEMIVEVKKENIFMKGFLFDLILYLQGLFMVIVKDEIMEIDDIIFYKWFCKDFFLIFMFLKIY